MSTRDEYAAKMKAQLEEWNAEIDRLEAEIRKAKARAGLSYQEKIEALKKRRDEAEKALAQVQDAGEDAWESFKKGTDQIWQSMKQTLHETKEAFREGLQEK